MNRRLDDPALLLSRADEARLAANSELDVERRSVLGQFMTPAPIAALMASMFDMRESEVRLLDAGAGVGSLTASFVSEACHRSRKPVSIEATAFELEPAMLGHLRAIVRACGGAAKRAGIRFLGRVVATDFMDSAASQLETALLSGSTKQTFNAAILNPPYRKIRSDSRERALLRAAGIETSNLYTAFVALAVRLLEPGGELVAITPRSFCNGPYFRPFRQLLLREMTLRRIHVFESRDRAFEGDDVLQENVIFHATKGVKRRKVVLSTSAAPDTRIDQRLVPHTAVVNPEDREAFIHLPVSETDEHAAAAIQALPCTLVDLGLQVSTGRVVDFRAREHLRLHPGPRTVPLIYPAHFEHGFVAWPRLNGKKANALADTAATSDLLIASGTYVLTKRFTSKEERRRVVAVVYDPARLPKGIERVGFENHVNYFRSGAAGLPKDVARGLAAFLNSSLVDQVFRQFNGHTQVNATDLRSLRYPSLEDLRAMGRRIGRAFPDQEGLDGILAGVVPSLPNDSAR